MILYKCLYLSANGALFIEGNKIKVACTKYSTMKDHKTKNTRLALDENSSLSGLKARVFPLLSSTYRITASTRKASCYG